jgi:hypothetical protein
LSNEAVATTPPRASRSRIWPWCARWTVLSGLPDAKHHWCSELSLEVETTTPSLSIQAARVFEYLDYR